LPLRKERGEELFQAFRQSGHVARQENVGMTVMPKLILSPYSVMAEGSPDAPGHTQVVMLSHPSMSEDEFDGWVEVVRTWSGAMSVTTRVAFSRMIRELKSVENGIPLTVLHKDMPPALLFSYRRSGDFVIVVDSWSGAKRKIYTSKNIG
jgi:hypothetical protein